MGIFDFLFGSGKKKPEEIIIEEIATAEAEFWNDPLCDRTIEELFDDMRAIIARNFPEYEVQYEYKAYNLDISCHPACTPIQFMFQKNGKNVLAVVIVGQNTYKGMNVLGTKKLCEEAGIPYIRFFVGYPNKEEYVIERIKKYLA